MLNPKSVFAPFDKSNNEPSPADNDSDLQSQIDDLKQRVSALEKDEASEQDIDATSNSLNIASGQKPTGM